MIKLFMGRTEQYGRSAYCDFSRMMALHIQLMKHQIFCGIISPRGNNNQPPRSYELTPLDFFLWSFLKKNFTLTTVKRFRTFRITLMQKLQKYRVSYMKVLSKIWQKKSFQRSKGGHLSHMVFYYYVFYFKIRVIVGSK